MHYINFVVIAALGAGLGVVALPDRRFSRRTALGCMGLLFLWAWPPVAWLTSATLERYDVPASRHSRLRGHRGAQRKHPGAECVPSRAVTGAQHLRTMRSRGVAVSPSSAAGSHFRRMDGNPGWTHLGRPGDAGLS